MYKKSIISGGIVMIRGGSCLRWRCQCRRRGRPARASIAVLVKMVRLGQGGFILTVAPVDDDRPQAEHLVTLTADARLRKPNGDLSN